MTVFLVLIVFAVYTTDGLNSIDAADFFVEEQRMQLRLVEASLQLIDHNNQSVLCLSEVLNHLFFTHSAIQCGTRLMPLVITIDNSDRRILVFLELRFLAFLGIQVTDDIEISDGIRYACYSQHSFTLTTNLLINQTYQTLYDE